MSITINTNATSLIAQRNLNTNQSSLMSSMERLSSGLRVNSAKDDAAGLAIAKNMEKDISAFGQAQRNINDGISVIQTTESAIDVITNSVMRMRDLAEQSANGTYSAANRSALQLEYSALTSEINRAAKKTEYNGVKLTDGSTTSLTIQVGNNNSSNDRIDISLTGISAGALSIDATSIGSASAAQASMDTLDAALKTLNASRAGLGASESRLGNALNSASRMAESLASAKSRIMDVDFASEVSNLQKNNVLTQAGSSMLAQANTLPQLALRLLG